MQQRSKQHRLKPVLLTNSSLQHRIRVRVIRTLLAPRAFIERFFSLGMMQRAARFDRSRNIPRDSRSQLHKLPARTFQREAVLIFSARWIRPECGNASSIFDFNRLRMPLFRRPVIFRRQPSLNMPAIVRHILRLETHFNNFAQQLSASIPVFPFPANPVQPRPSPHRAVVRLAKSIAPARKQKFLRDLGRRLMRFSKDLDQGIGKYSAANGVSPNGGTSRNTEGARNRGLKFESHSG
jgi:hypothetical protein